MTISIGRNDFYPKIENSITLWGESSFIAYIYLFEYFSKISKRNFILFEWLIFPLKALITYNGRKGTNGLHSPYYKIQTSINFMLGLEEDDNEMNESFVERSFYVKPIIDLLVRYNRRDVLEVCWRDLTYIQQEKFLPEEKWMFFLWHSERGKNISEFSKQTQSWKELVNEVNEIDTNEVPEMLLKLPFFLPLFILVFPHRINTNLTKLLDNLVNRK